MKGMVNHQSNAVTTNGPIIAEIPPTNNRFAMFEPIKFPIRILDSPFFKLENVTASSGIEVPKAIKLSAIISSLILIASASPTAELTKNFELATNAANANKDIPNNLTK